MDLGFTSIHQETKKKESFPPPKRAERKVAEQLSTALWKSTCAGAKCTGTAWQDS